MCARAVSCLSVRLSSKRVARGGEFVCAGGVCVRNGTSFASGFVFRSLYGMRVCVCVCARARVHCRCAPTLAGRGTAVADHYRQGDSGRREFSGVCLRLSPLLNECCSISLIMPPLRLMSLLSDSKVCKKAPLLSGLFAFLIGLNERACLSSCPAIHSPRSGWRCG